MDFGEAIRVGAGLHAESLDAFDRAFARMRVRHREARSHEGGGAQGHSGGGFATTTAMFRFPDVFEADLAATRMARTDNMMRRRWDFFVKWLLDAEPPKQPHWP
jgi:hypothetical protein